MSGWEVCIDCGDRLLTASNSARVVDQKSLAVRFMPQGGCQCGIFFADVNPECPVCFPAELRCNRHPSELHGNFSSEPRILQKLKETS